jgi:hypothetical protein
VIVAAVGARLAAPDLGGARGQPGGVRRRGPRGDAPQAGRRGAAAAIAVLFQGLADRTQPCVAMAEARREMTKQTMKHGVRHPLVPEDGLVGAPPIPPAPRGPTAPP